jgi:hypothetical protein
MSKTTSIGPLSIVSYISFTLIFFIIKGTFLPTTGPYWIIIFFFITGLIQFINNLYLTSLPEICGEYNISNAFFATLIPWIFIFGITCLCLIMIPGWLRVFSNTFGASIADMAGLGEVALLILGTKNEQISDFGTKKIIELIYSNPHTIINEVELNYDAVSGSWPSLEKVVTFLGNESLIGTDPYKENIAKLFKLLSLKEDVGYFVWLVLIGSITILVSTNSVLITKCSTNSL